MCDHKHDDKQEGKPGKNKTVPVTVLTGFLGSGKTTLLNHILRSPDHGMRFAIIENEFGDVSVDDKVIHESVDEEVIEVVNGCICCKARGDFIAALTKLHGKVESFDGVIIETTGLADPAPVAQTFFIDKGLQKMYRLDGIVTVVDAKHISMHLNDKKSEDECVEAVEQLAFADRILLNKTDLLPDAGELDRLEERIKAINQHVPLYRCQHGEVDPKHLINMGAFDIDRALKLDPKFLDASSEHTHVHDASVSSVSYKFEGNLHILKLQEWIADLIKTKGEELYRYKGVVAVQGMPAKFVFQGVHQVTRGAFSEVKWKDDEPRECRFVFIGRNLDKEALTKGLMACKVEGELRFKVGDDVDVTVGKGRFKRGRVTELWKDGHPYAVRLAKVRKVLLLPFDEERFVRLPAGAAGPADKSQASESKPETAATSDAAGPADEGQTSGKLETALPSDAAAPADQSQPSESKPETAA